MYIIIVHDYSSRLHNTISTLPFAKATSKKRHDEVDNTNNDDDDNDDDEDSIEDDTILSTIDVHTTDKPKYSIKSELKSESISSSCRAITFSNDGQYLYTASNGGSLACLDVQSASHYSTSEKSLLWKRDDASPHGIHVLHQITESSPAGPLIVSGDDEGVVRLWDVRLCCGDSKNNSDKGKSAFDGLLSLPKGCVASFHEHKDYISGFETDAAGNTLIVTSADGTLSVIDLRKNGGNDNAPKGTTAPVKSHVKSGAFHLIRQSDDQEDELLSVCLMKGGKKVICGTQNGVLNVWSWGTWGDISDRFPGHPQSIDAILKVDEDTILTGSSDGVVRVMQVHPDRLLGVLGDHDGFPVENLKFSHDRKIVGSISHDVNIRMWDASILTDDDFDEDVKGGSSSMEEDGLEAVSGQASSGLSNSSPVARDKCDSEDDWEDVDDSDDDSMDDSDDSDEEQTSKKPRFKTENEQFFADL